jgi:hypothetical protein
MPADIGHHSRHGAAGNRFLDRPEQFGHIGRPHQDERLGIKAEAHEARTVGHSQFLGFIGQLQVNDGKPLLGDEASCLGQGKAQNRAGIAAFSSEHLLQQPSGQHRKPLRILLDHRPRLGQSRLALDIGNAVPQRSDALLAIGGAHRSHLPE